MSDSRVTVETAKAAALCMDILCRAGVPQEDADIVTNSLLLAEMSHMSSHGLMRLKPTVERIRLGLVKARPCIQRQQKADNILCYDADCAMGQVAGHRAIMDCIQLAKETGMAVAVIRHAFHFGMIGSYARTASEHGCMAFACTNSSAQMAPWGGIDKALGTNPFAVAFPTGENTSFSLDVSTAAAARGKIRLAAREGREIPLGWAVDENGRDTTNASQALSGTVLPMAGHKGFGMAMAVDWLSGILSGADLSYEASNMFEDKNGVNTGCFFLVLDISRFVNPEEYADRTGAWINNLRSSRLREGFEGIHIPGDTQNALRQGLPETITVTKSTWDDLQAL